MSTTSLADPFFLAHRALRAEISSMARNMKGTVVDVGCGTAPYRALFSHARYVGIEVAGGSKFGSAKGGADVLYDGRRLPLADGSVDNVLCNQVLEHVFEPTAFLSELRRVLRPGGQLVVTVPFVWDEHEQPYDFARYSSFGLRYLATKCGFEVAEARRTLSDASLFAQLWLAYWFKVVHRDRRASLSGKLCVAAMSVPVNMAGMALAKLLPASPDLYLDNVMVMIRLPEELRHDD